MPGWRASGMTEVVACCDIDGAVLRKWSSEFEVGRTYERAEDLVRDPDIDIVDICTPNGFHAPYAVAALRAGRHVICEKPLAPTPGEVRSMIAARDASGKLLMTAQHFRFKGSSRALKAEIDASPLGGVYHARCWMLRRFLMPVRPGFILKEQSGGGACIDIGVHILDLALWLMGNPKPAAVSGVARTELAKRPGTFSVWAASIPPEMRRRGVRLRPRALRRRSDARAGGELAAAPQHRGRGRADLALRTRRRLPLAVVHRDLHQLRHEAALPPHAAAHEGRGRAARAGVHRVRRGRSTPARPRRSRRSSRWTS